jgi:hypothetical protein
MFIKLENGQPVGHAVTEDNFRLLFPDTNLSLPFVAEEIEPLGFGLYDFSSQPDLGTFEKAVEVTPVKDEYGRWIQAWAVEPMNEEEVAARTEQEWEAVRLQRHFLLTRSDWTQLPDAPVDSVTWATYRQALRDITTQSDPFNIVWPSASGAGNI